MSLSNNIKIHIERIGKNKKQRAELARMAEEMKSERIISDEELCRSLQDYVKKESKKDE
jgi:hypothetical protein